MDRRLPPIPLAMYRRFKTALRALAGTYGPGGNMNTSVSCTRCGAPVMPHKIVYLAREHGFWMTPGKDAKACYPFDAFCADKALKLSEARTFDRDSLEQRQAIRRQKAKEYNG